MSRPRYVLGISMSNHDRAACLLVDGRIAGAVAEERLDRRKSSEGFYRRGGRGVVLPPLRAITRLLRDTGIRLDDLDLVVCGRSITTCREELLDHLPIAADKVVEPPKPSHHLAHAYSAYATMPYPESAVLVIDEQGHWLDDRFERCSWYAADAKGLRPVRQFHGDRFNLSLGMFYNVFAALAGLAEAGRPAAGKLMSLAGFGQTRNDWPDLLTLTEDGDVGVGLDVIDRFLTTAGVPTWPGVPERTVSDLDGLLVKYRPVGWRSALGQDLARKAQEELERGILHTAARLREHTGLEKLAYAGGVALNCSVNARLDAAGWRDVHVHPAATDDGTALGLATYGWIEVLDGRRNLMRNFSPHVGPRHEVDSAAQALESFGLDGHLRPAASVETVAELVAAGAVVCWFTGRSEWGPRALGARSIVASPLTPGVTERINSTVKFREPFRPFGVSLLRDAAEVLIDRKGTPPGLDGYMLGIAYPIHPGLGAVAHVDGTLRYQLVDRDRQSMWYRLISAVGSLTEMPAVVNTSFNTLGEPLVESPGDAVRQFLLSDADALWLDGHLLVTADLPIQVRREARELAWERSSLDPLDVAVGLEAAGYPAAAAKVLVEHPVADGEYAAASRDRIRSHHALLLRLASANGDTESATQHSSEVLRWWLFPPDVMRAAAHLATDEEQSAPALTGKLITAGATNRSALEFFLQLVKGATG